MAALSLPAVLRQAKRCATLGVLALCACGGGSCASSSSPANEPIAPSQVSAAPADRPPASTWFGVTTDDPNTGTAAQVATLAALPARIAVRVVLDEGMEPADYVASVRKLAAVADVMALPVDSSWMKDISVAQAGARARRYLAALQDVAPIWEVGNEVNGNWVGPDPVAKIEAMFDAARAYGRKTALTFYYENPATPGHDMLPWIDANIPAGHRLRTGLDLVLVSYYEDQNGGHQLSQQEIDALFSGLARRFPNAKVGFGEFGWGRKIPASAATRAELIERFHAYTSSEPAFIGGGFYWHFRQTMSPATKPDFALLQRAAACRAAASTPR